MLDRLTRVLGSTKQNDVGASRSAQRELIECQTFTASLLDARASSRSEAKGANRQLGDFIEAVVVCNRADDCPDLALMYLFARGVVSDGDDFGQRDRRPVDLAHAKTAEDGLVEGGVGTSAQEAVELVQQSEVWVVAVRSLSVATRHMVSIKIDLYEVISIISSDIEVCTGNVGAGI